MIKRIYIEITNICNLSCAFCLKTSRNPHAMSTHEFEKVLIQARKVTPYIYLHVQGEPLSHPEFNEILSLCDRYEMQVQLVTNGTLLYRHEKLYDHPSVRKVSFSLQSVEFHKNTEIRDYMNRIISFAENCSALGRPYCEIRFWRTDQSDMPRTAECMQMILERFTPEESDRRGSRKLMSGVYLSSDNMFDWPSLNTEDDNTKGTCRGAIDQIAILSDGTVTPCCLDNDGTIKLGNIFRNSLEEILHSPRYLAIVEGFRKNFITEDLCRRCTFRHRFDRKVSKQ